MKGAGISLQKYVISMKYLVNWGGGDGVFAVPDFAADCLKLASGKAVKVLLYILKNKISEIDFSSVGEAVGISSEDAEDAVSYWQQVGVLYTEGNSPADVHTKTVKENSSPVQKKNSAAEQNSHEKSAKMISPEEIADRIEHSEDVKFLFSAAEETLGKILNYTEQRSILWLHDYYNIAPDILLMIMDLSRQINKSSIGYIEKIAISWHDKNITTHEQASREIISIKNYFSLEGQVSAKLGLNRTLTPTEKKFVKEWSDKDISIDLIIYSYEKTIDSIGKVKFSYMNKILSSWHEKGISTVASAKADSKEHTGSVSNVNNKKNQENSGEHSYNLSLLVEHAMNNTPKIKGN